MSGNYGHEREELVNNQFNKLGLSERLRPVEVKSNLH